jgi:hypothetical protein
MLFYITGGAPQAVPGTACVEANQTACTEVCCSSGCKSSTEVFNDYHVVSCYRTIRSKVRPVKELENNFSPYFCCLFFFILVLELKNGLKVGVKLVIIIIICIVS